MNSNRLIVFIVSAVLSTSVLAQANLDKKLTTKLVDQAVDRLVEYIKVDTVNPPGNEARAAAFFAQIFDREGINYEIIETAPGRSNIVARLTGGDKPGIVLLNHTDVVPFDESNWQQPPMAGRIVDGMLYGRGAQDMKNVGIIQLQAFLYLHRSGVKLNRDVMFAATADEEAGGNLGAGFLVKERPELFAGIGFSLNEGGGGRLRSKPEFSISVVEKTPYWIKLTANGAPGHGSTPSTDTAVKKLISALDNVPQWYEPRVLPVMREYLKQVAPGYPDYFRQRFLDIDNAIDDKEFIQRLKTTYPQISARLSNTCSITRLDASQKVNVIPNSASAELDCRLLPDQNRDEFERQLLSQLNEPAITLEKILSFEPSTSTMDSELYQTIEEFVMNKYPEAQIIPSLTAGFTDSHWFREMGITSYGFTPTLAEPEKNGGFHGNDERISIANLKTATQNMIELMVKFTTH